MPIPFSKSTFQWAPERASSFAGEIDRLTLFLLGVSIFFTLLIAALIIYFALRYRRRSETEVPAPPASSTALEVAWTVVPLCIVMVMFFWGASLFVTVKRPPANAMEIYVVGKQWMWKVQHPEGAREIDELHVPMSTQANPRPIKLIMTSQDVIHDFSIPAFRIKQDVLPGSYVTQWFEATRPGEYHLFCAEYCGTMHSEMVGRVVVMEPAKYEAWLAGAPPDEPPASAGAKLFNSYGCMACHGQQAPTMAGLFGRQQRLEGGRTVLADEGYLRESILEPRAKIVAGYPPIMPTYRGQLSEEQIMQLVAYIKSLASARAETPGDAATQPATTQPGGASPPEQVPNFPPAREPAHFDDSGRRNNP